MAVDVRHEEHLDEVVANRSVLQVDVGGLRAQEQVVPEGLPPRLVAGDRDTQAPSPDPKLTLKQAGEGQGEGLGRLVGRVVIDLGGCPVETPVVRRRLAKDKGGVGGQGG